MPDARIRRAIGTDSSRAIEPHAFLRPRSRQRSHGVRPRPRATVGASGDSSPNQVFRYSSEFRKGDAVESDAGWHADVQAFQYRRHQIYGTNSGFGKSHAGSDRDLHMLRDETAMTGPMLRDFPGAPEIRPRRGRQGEIAGPGAPKQL